MTTSRSKRSTAGARPSWRRLMLLLVGVLVLVLPATMALASNNGQANNDKASDNSTADITVTFDEDCSGFHVESSKEISFVSTNTADGEYHKFEGEDIQSEDQDQDGDDPDGSDRHDFSYDQDDPYKSIVVKSGQTMEVFDCPEGGGEVDPEDGAPECSDSTDNDNDGLVDHPDDPGCETPDDDDERDSGDTGDDCAERGDADEDGICDDEDTEGPPGDPSCDDTVDNDGDGLTDGDDPDCQDDGGTEGPQGDETCDDTVDNDGDGLVDEDDPDCNEGANDGEFCDDTVDNDGDGLTDGDDPDCQDDGGTEGPQGDETCDDTVDNDGDGLVDEDDPDCNEGANDGEFCDDTVDNDGDGLTDGDDPDCQDGTNGAAAESQLLNLGALSAVSDVISNGANTDPESEEDEGILSALADGMDLLLPSQECPLPVAAQCGLLWETDDDENSASTGVLLVEDENYTLYVVTSQCGEAKLLEASFMGQGVNLWDALNDGSGGALAEGVYALSLEIQENGNVLVLDLGGAANDPSSDGPLGELVVGHAQCESAE